MRINMPSKFKNITFEKVIPINKKLFYFSAPKIYIGTSSKIPACGTGCKQGYSWLWLMNILFFTGIIVLLVCIIK